MTEKKLTEQKISDAKDAYIDATRRGLKPTETLEVLAPHLQYEQRSEAEPPTSEEIEAAMQIYHSAPFSFRSAIEAGLDGFCKGRSDEIKALKAEVKSLQSAPFTNAQLEKMCKAVIAMWVHRSNGWCAADAAEAVILCLCPAFNTAEERVKIEEIEVMRGDGLMDTEKRLYRDGNEVKLLDVLEYARQYLVAQLAKEVEG
jgi:hypothetical protein